jgi:hypothetical protein
MPAIPSDVNSNEPVPSTTRIKIHSYEAGLYSDVLSCQEKPTYIEQPCASTFVSGFGASHRCFFLPCWSLPAAPESNSPVASAETASPAIPLAGKLQVTIAPEKMAAAIFGTFLPVYR